MEEKKQSENWATIVGVIADKLRKKPEDIKPEHRIIEDLGADSLDLVEMLMDLEETWNVIIPDDVAMTLKTVGQFADYLDSTGAKA